MYTLAPRLSKQLTTRALFNFVLEVRPVTVYHQTQANKVLTHQTTTSVQRGEGVCVVENGSGVEAGLSFKVRFILDAPFFVPLFHHKALGEESLIPPQL